MLSVHNVPGTNDDGAAPLLIAVCDHHHDAAAGRMNEREVRKEGATEVSSRIQRS